MVQDLNQKLLESNKQASDLKFKLNQMQTELDQANKEKAELSNQLKQKEAVSSSTVDQQEVKRLQEEIAKLRSLNKNRDQILAEIDEKNKALRESETNLKMVQNDLELIQSQNQSYEIKNKQQADKLRDIELKLNQAKEQVFTTEKAKEQQQIEFESKIEGLK